ncbi:MAG: hypothetical protein RLZZ450_2879 [Pseudomonadota bacterium]
MVATVITLVPHPRSSIRTQGHAHESPTSGGPGMRSFAVEPTGEGAYVEAVREWIERVTPRSSARPALYLVR